jgi:hypothetical protein
VVGIDTCAAGKSLCDSCECGLSGTYLQDAQQEGARRGVQPTMNRIIEKVECPCCRSTVLVSASEKVQRFQALSDRGKQWALVSARHSPQGRDWDREERGPCC